VFEKLKQLIAKRFQYFLNRRLPVSHSITLNQKRLFIFPSRSGWWYFFLLLVILMVAINYQNNMAFALVFLLASVFVVGILHTFANLSGLTITALRSEPVFSGDYVQLQIELTRSGKRRYFDIRLSWPDAQATSVTLSDNSAATATLYVPVAGRGWFRPNRLTVATVYPLGLLRCWSLLLLDIDVLVYPKPMAAPLSQAQVVEGEADGERLAVVGADDFYEFSEYHPGDPLKHVHWKGYAKGQGLLTKQFASYSEQQHYLDWQDFQGDVEQRLSYLCYWILQLEKTADDYGLRLPGIEFAPAHGRQHQQKLLKALALFRLGDAETQENLDQPERSQ
jgi:uncharacterized protein (DUF58 family)